MASIRVKTTTDAKGIQNLNTALQKTDEELKDITKRAKGAEAAAQRLAKQADPQKRYNDQMAKLALAVKKGGLSIQDAEVQAKKYQRRLEGVGQAGKSTFGARAVGQVGAMVTGFVSLQAAAGAVLGILTEIQQKQKQLAEEAIQGLPAKAKLAQLAGADSAKLRRLNRAADVTFGEGFVASREASHNLAFELDSANLLKERKFFSQLSLIGDAATIAQSVGKIKAGFAGGDPTGTARQVVSKAQAAAGPLPGLSAGQLASMAARTAGLAKDFGATDEGLFAATSQVAGIFGERASDRMNALFTAATRKGLATGEGGIPGLISNLKSRGFNPQQMLQFLGSSEAAQTFAILKDQETFSKRLASIEAGAQSDLAGRSIRNELADDRTLAAVLARRGKARNVLSQDDLVARQNLGVFVRQEMERFRRERGDPEFLNAAETFLRRKRDAFDGPEETIGAGERMGLIPETGSGRLELLLERQTEIQQRQLDLLESGAVGRQE